MLKIAYREKWCSLCLCSKKGADSKMIRELNRGLINFAKVVKNDLQKIFVI